MPSLAILTIRLEDNTAFQRRLRSADAFTPGFLLTEVKACDRKQVQELRTSLRQGMFTTPNNRSSLRNGEAYTVSIQWAELAGRLSQALGSRINNEFKMELSNMPNDWPDLSVDFDVVGYVNGRAEPVFRISLRKF